GKAADKYQLCTFTAPVDELIVDERGVDAWWCQGNNESDIRDMQSRHSVYLGLQVLGSGFKYAVQDRADGTDDGSGLHEWIGCTVLGGPHHEHSCVTIGWMAKSAGIASRPLGCSRWVDSTMDGFTQENPTCRRIEMIDAMVGGKKTTKTVTN